VSIIDLEMLKTRQEHIDWVKKRALQYVQLGYSIKAIDSIASDLQKHPETKGHLAPELALQLYIAGKLSTPEEVVKFIEGIS
jgi:hypothetical protein